MMCNLIGQLLSSYMFRSFLLLAVYNVICAYNADFFVPGSFVCCLCAEYILKQVVLLRDKRSGKCHTLGNDHHQPV